MKITKLLVITLVSTILLLISLGVYAMYAPQDSPVHTIWKYAFWKFPYTEYVFLNNTKIREYFGFYMAGSEKYNLYRDNNYKNIVVNMYLEDNEEIKQSAPNQIEQVFTKVFDNKTITLKQAELLDPDKKLTFIDIYTKYNSDYQNDETRVINLIVTTQYISEVMKPVQVPDASGVAINSRTIAIQYPTPKKCFPACEDTTMWNHQLQIYTYPKELKEKSFRSTLTHEIGHLLGLIHRNDKNCVMNPKKEMEVSDKVMSLSQIHTALEDALVFDFCAYEEEMLNQIRNIPLIRFGEYEEILY